MSFLELYLFTRLDGICIVLISTALIACIGSAVSLFLLSEAYGEEDTKKMTKWLRNCAITTIIATTGAVLVPTQEDAIVMYGMHWATNNEDAKNIPNDAVRVIREWINKASPKQDTITQGAKP